MAPLTPAPAGVELTITDGIARIRLADVAGRNALSRDLVTALEAALREAARARVVLLTGLPDIFCSGAAPSLLAELERGHVMPTELLLARRLMDLPVPVVAAAEGGAIGGGLALLFAADLPMLARESRYGANFVTLGITPGMGITRLLEHALSPALAHRLLYTGALLRGEELGARHLRDELLAAAEDTCARIAEQPPRAIRLLKRTLSLPRRRAFEESWTLESLMHELTVPDLDLEQLWT